MTKPKSQQKKKNPEKDPATLPDPASDAPETSGLGVDIAGRQTPLQGESDAAYDELLAKNAPPDPSSHEIRNKDGSIRRKPGRRSKADIEADAAPVEATPREMKAFEVEIKGVLTIVEGIATQYMKEPTPLEENGVAIIVANYPVYAAENGSIFGKNAAVVGLLTGTALIALDLLLRVRAKRKSAKAELKETPEQKPETSEMVEEKEDALT